MSLLYHMTGEPGLQEASSGPGPWDQLVTAEGAPPPPAASQPYPRENPDAFPVNQRSPQHWTGQGYIVRGAVGKATRLLTAQKGRKGFTLIVPSTSPAGVYLDSSQETLVSAGIQGFPVVAGAGVSVETEDEVWAISATPGTDTTVALIVTWG